MPLMANCCLSKCLNMYSTNLSTSLLPFLSKMSPITLGEMDGIRLMNRIDTKYVCTQAVLEKVLEDARQYYLVLENCGSRIADYNTLYYDTETYRMYLDHHNQRLTRNKVRTRTYLSSDDTYLEIKRKNNRGRTKKKRIPIRTEEFYSFASNSSAEEFLKSRTEFSVAELSPSTRTSFSRITLVNKAKTERLTIDSNLKFENLRNGRKSELGDCVIIELKQNGWCHSEIKDILLNRRVHPMRVSKYCIGTALTCPQIKKSRFIGKIRTIEKLINNSLLVR